MLCFLDMTDDCGRAKMSKQSVSRAGGPDGNVSRGSSRGRSPPMGRCWHLGWKQERELRKWQTSEDHHKTCEVQRFRRSSASSFPVGSSLAALLPPGGQKDQLQLHVYHFLELKMAAEFLSHFRWAADSCVYGLLSSQSDPPSGLLPRGAVWGVSTRSCFRPKSRSVIIPSSQWLPVNHSLPFKADYRWLRS